MPRGELLDEAIDPSLQIAACNRRPHRRCEHRRRQHFVQAADPCADQPRQFEHVGPRARVALAGRDWRPEGDERARPVSDRVADHLGELARERTLPLLDLLVRENVIFEHEIVRDGGRDDDEVGSVRRQRRIEQAGLRRLQLAAVAAAAFRVEEQVVLLENFRNVRLQRDQVRGILHVAPDRYGARHVLVNQSEGTAEQIDARGDERWTNPVVVEYQRFNQVIGMALVVRRVHNPVRADRRRHVVQVFVFALDLPQNGIEGMLQCAVELVPLRGAELVQIRVHLLARILEHVFACEDGERNVVQHSEPPRTIARLQSPAFHVPRSKSPRNRARDFR